MLYKFYQAIFSIIDEKNKRKFMAVIITSIIASILETVTISSIFPFMSIVTDPMKIHSNKYYFYLYNGLNFSSEVTFITFLGVLIIMLFILKSLFNVFSSFIAYSFGNNVTKNIRIKILTTYLSQKYIYYLRENKSHEPDLLGSIGSISNAIASFSTIITESLIVIIMYIILMIFNWKIMLGITVFLMVNVLFVQKIIHPKIAMISHNTWLNNTLSYKFMNALVNNYKIIKLVFHKQIYINDYDHIISKYHSFDCRRMILEKQPKNILELSGFSIMIGLVIYQELLYGINSSSALIPVISLLMLTFYRLLPSVTKILEAKNSIIHITPVIERIHSELNKQTEVIARSSSINITRNLRVQNINFSYSKDKQILSGISLTINKGEHVAFIGASGSGKSTLVDIIMGFYDSEDNIYKISGKIIVDDYSLTDHDLAAWRRNIGYIPQEIYLFDGTVAENIVMNNDFNEEKVIVALKKACIWEFLKQKEGIHTHVGDGGVMLSGGQKQRIGIARALYNDPEIIIMDEATSALDDHTESQIIEELNNSAREKTIIMIAHRISSLKNCNKIYELNDGIIINTYNNILEIL